MAIQSEIYSGTALTSRTFPTTKHIATKANMAVWLQDTNNVWSQMNETDYQLINNSCVLNTLLDTSVYISLEIRVADIPSELTTSISDIAKVASISADVTKVANIDTNVTKVASDTVVINDVASNPLRQSILDSGSNATIATTQATNSKLSAWKAQAEEMTANSYATEPENTYVKKYTSNGDGTFTVTNTTEYSALHHQSKTKVYADTYQGSGATDPTVRNDGSPLQAGDLFFNTTLNEMRVYSGTIWKSAGSTVNGTAQRQVFTATAGQTVFTITGGYDAGFADVYLNGAKLQNGVDVIVTSGTEIVLSVGATAGDIVDVVAYGSFTVANTYTKAEVDSKDALKADKSYVDSQDTNLQKQINTKLSKVASSVLLNTNSLSISNTLKTKNFAEVTYTGNGATQSITTGINSVDFTVANNGSGYWLDRTVNQIKNNAGTVVASGTCDWGTNKGVSKVHIKSRSNAYYNVVIDGLRGSTNEIYTNITNSESTLYSIDAFTATGITLSANFNYTNSPGDSLVLYQTLYTHIKWGTTNQGKFYVEAYNPVTKEGMIYYIGSGTAGHQIPHSMGVELGITETKNLSGTSDWYACNNTFGRMKLTLIDAAINDGYAVSSTSLLINTNTLTTETNTLNNKYILYYKCKSETWTIGTYTGTGAAGNFIETKDVNGVARKPSRVIIKRIDNTGYWIVADTTRGDKYKICLNVPDAETTGSNISVSANGFILLANETNTNLAGSTNLYLVEFDTNAVSGTPDGSYYNYPTATSNINITSGNFTYTDGKDVNGYKLSSESVTGSIDFTGVADGLHWVARDKVAGTYTTRATKPTFDTATGKWSNETNVLSFLKSPIMVTSQTPQYIDYNQELIENTMDSLDIVGQLSSNTLLINSLPTANTGIAGALWNNNGTVQIS